MASIPLLRSCQWQGLLITFICLNFFGNGKYTFTFNKCPGRTVIKDRIVGIIITSKYFNNVHCEWEIHGGKDNIVKLKVIKFETEYSFDFVHIYDGCGPAKRQVAAISGRLSSLSQSLFFSTSSCLTVYFASDMNLGMSGFQLKFVTSTCPDNCDASKGCTRQKCAQCVAGYFGDSCRNTMSPFCHQPCGRWNETLQRCVCNSVMTGFNCGISLDFKSYITKTNKWYPLWPKDLGSESLFKGRVFHASCYSSARERLLVYGGKDLNGTIFDTLVAFNLGNLGGLKGKWVQVDGQASSTTRPKGRFGHQMVMLDSENVYVYGGYLDIVGASISNELWTFSLVKARWRQLLCSNGVVLPALVYFSLTPVNRSLWLFGGLTEGELVNGELFRIDIHSEYRITCHLVHPAGGWSPEMRLLGHTTIYDEATHRLLVYGGRNLLFSPREHLMGNGAIFQFSMDRLFWSKLAPTNKLNDQCRKMPLRRVFHSAVRMGDFMVVYGGAIEASGNSRLDRCLDNSMLFYHLRCHRWYTMAEILSLQHSFEKSTMEKSVRFGHSAVAALGNVLIIVGGFGGSLYDDVSAYVVPSAVSRQEGDVTSPSNHCGRYEDDTKCSLDPPCVWCDVDTSSRCLPREDPTKLVWCSQIPNKQCPGLCPTLTDCVDCLRNRNGKWWGSCTWRFDEGICVNNYGVKSWLQTPHVTQCINARNYSGYFFQSIFMPRRNFSSPDWVNYLSHGEKNLFSIPSWQFARFEKLIARPADGGLISLRYRGLIRPKKYLPTAFCVNVNSSPIVHLDMSLGSQGSARTAKLVRPSRENGLEQCYRLLLHSNTTFYIALNWTITYGSSSLERLGKLANNNWLTLLPYGPLTSGEKELCRPAASCFACVELLGCVWCPTLRRCFLGRNVQSDGDFVCPETGHMEYPVVELYQCLQCVHASCVECSRDPFCEWAIAESLCLRRGQLSPGNDSRVVTQPQQCNSCTGQSSCDTCLSTPGCAWCRSTQRCFSYFLTSTLVTGDCDRWAIASIQAEDRAICRSCSSHKLCSQCLADPACGWCYRLSSPPLAACVEGEFWGPALDGSCAAALNQTGVTSKDFLYAYTECPQVDECALGWATDCHENALCVDTKTEYTCECRPGFVGDGRQNCTKVCHPACVHGVCLGAPTYKCSCELGWTGGDCNTSCGCHGHSACPSGPGLCLSCEHGTNGSTCGECLPNHYGDPTSVEGCQPCICNSHTAPDGPMCNTKTGHCYCVHNTEGAQCQKCADGFWGDPRDGRPCYVTCQGRRGWTVAKEGLVGRGPSSVQRIGVDYCSWLISPYFYEREQPRGVTTFIIQIDSIQRLSCQRGGLYIYDGIVNVSLPQLSAQNKLVAAVCQASSNPSRTEPLLVTADSGLLSLVYFAEAELNATFRMNFSLIHCPQCGFGRECVGFKCQCPSGKSGPLCEMEICPDQCSGKGVCRPDLGGCQCSQGHTGPACASPVMPETSPPQPWVERMRLFQSEDEMGARWGHALVACHGGVWQMGGMGASGVTDDVFRLQEGVWVRLQPNKSSENPPKIAFHAVACDNESGIIYLFGGSHTLTLVPPLKTNVEGPPLRLWMYHIRTNSWTSRPVEAPSIPMIVGHSMELVRSSGQASLLIIGGLSGDRTTERFSWKISLAAGAGPLLATFNLDKIPAGFALCTVTASDGQVIVRLSRRADINPEMALRHKRSVIWMLIMPGDTGNEEEAPSLRSFASCAMVDDQLLLFGGRDSTGLVNDSSLYVYTTASNMWHRVSYVGDALPKVFGAAMTAAPGQKGWTSVYISGGITYDGQFSTGVYELRFPNCTEFRCPWSPRQIERTGDENCLLSSTCLSCTTAFGLGSLLSLERNHPKCLWKRGLGCRQRATWISTPESTPMSCHHPRCYHTNCHDCRSENGCTWAKKNLQSRSWSCLRKSRFMLTPEQNCPIDCSSDHANCSSCLLRGCRWLPVLGRCVDASFVDLVCVGPGSCGPVLQWNCVPECAHQKRCASCVTTPGCGWLRSRPIMNDGRGVCLLGGFSGPSNEDHLAGDFRGTWSYMNFEACPRENECANGHHNCSSSETCLDKPVGFVCECKKPGYERDTRRGECKPICTPGCLKGRCVRPDECKCNFGYIGPSCSQKCDCHGHSDCSPRDKADCLACRNHTKGPKCSFCEPLYVGDPTNGIPCKPCLDFCSRHTDICLKKFELLLKMDRTKIDTGPIPKDAVCVECKHNTAGGDCSECRDGFFRLAHNRSHACQPCQCNGHAPRCFDQGIGCNCANNTETPNDCTRPNHHISCWQKQCSKCKRYFSGDPKNGRQCYLQMSLEKRYCLTETLSRTSIAGCDQFSNPLPAGRAVFFSFKPHYNNVNIRVTLDVLQGEVEVFVTTAYDVLVVHNDPTTWTHTVTLDVASAGSSWSPAFVVDRKRRSVEYRNGTVPPYSNFKVLPLLLTSTANYAHLTSSQEILILRGIRRRLVVSINQALHELRTTQFYLLIRAVHNTMGEVQFGQYQPHVDLFVFFSVFFSFFFLLLAVCVIAWRMKQLAERRRSSLRETRERITMASRPFSTALVWLSNEEMRKAHGKWSAREPRPIGVEPVSDGSAAVVTMVIQLPSSPGLCLGSALVLRQKHAIGVRRRRRRRSNMATTAC